MDTTPDISELREALSTDKAPIAKRMRSVYWLRFIHDNQESLRNEVLNILYKALLTPSHGSLLRHEIAYVLGQLQEKKSTEILEQILCNKEEDSMLRHECAEALGAIGTGFELLVKLANDPNEPFEVSQTCEIAKDFILWKESGKEGPVIACACMVSPFNSRDPAPPDLAHRNLSTNEIQSILLNTENSAFDRYRAMFSLRNRATDEAVVALGNALVEDKSSPLLRHEIAFVLGQLENACALPFLEQSLRRVDEHKIVRHESAEALGALSGCWEKSKLLLEEFCSDSDVVIRESCIVALDAADYFGKTAEIVEQMSQGNMAFTKQKAGKHFNTIETTVES